MGKDLKQLQYPIGSFESPANYEEAPISNWIETIARFPSDLTSLVENLDEQQLDTPYRPGGWTIRQLVHHVGDSHMNSYVRFKWTLTEDQPVIKAYYEDRWAELPDSKGDILPGLALVKALHEKWVILLQHLGEEELHRSFIHPETKKEIPLWLNIGLYDWHCRHHLAHISGLLQRKGW
ncbi:MAG: putative metal-dependent hydrolase [Cytophagales bacterium]|nr:putative metal-dependent hydrolase [Cytophagales bacterium]